MSSGRLMDVCQQPGVQINCSQVSADGYDATNLISKDFHQKRMGFMAASFIKPPVEIDLTLPCSTHLSHIVIGTTVGNQKSNGFELTTGNNTFLGRTPYQNKFNTDKICFVNNAFRTRNYFNRNEIVFPTNSTRLNLRTPAGMQRLRIQNLRIRILSTQGSSIPCLGALEVWGIPAFVANQNISPDNTEKQTKEEDTNQLQEPLCPPVPVIESNLVPSGPDPSVDIPEEFMDSLTCEMMSLPVLLPSGNTIDQSSIDRHLKAEALWGRCPSDPFTGIPFGPGYAPLPNVHLKSRIDRFLLVQGTNLQVPRTVGGNSSQRNVSRLLGETVCGKRLPDDSESGETCNVAKRVRIPPAVPPAVHMFQNGGEKTESHEDELKNSLESALSVTLRDLKSYTEPQQVQVDVVQCCQCLKVTGNLYRLRCSHVLCGPCIQMKLSSIKTLCSQCQLPFTSADPCKIHVI